MRTCGDARREREDEAVVLLSGVVEERDVIALAEAQHALEVAELAALERRGVARDVARADEEARHSASPRADPRRASRAPVRPVFRRATRVRSAIGGRCFAARSPACDAGSRRLFRAALEDRRHPRPAADHLAHAPAAAAEGAPQTPLLRPQDPRRDEAAAGLDPVREDGGQRDEHVDVEVRDDERMAARRRCRRRRWAGGAAPAASRRRRNPPVTARIDRCGLRVRSRRRRVERRRGKA